MYDSLPEDREPGSSRSIRKGGIKKGMRVQSHGLKNHAHLNDAYGTAVAWMDAKGRWQIRFDTTEEI